MTTVIPIATCNVTGGSVTTIGAVTDAVTGLPLASVVATAPIPEIVSVVLPAGTVNDTAEDQFARSGVIWRDVVCHKLDCDVLRWALPFAW